MTADTPRYAQIFDTLSKRVQTGLYPIDMRLPTESELCGEFNASRFTIREALRRMLEQGMVQRRQGAGSVVVSTRPQARYVHTLSSLSDLFQFALVTTCCRSTKSRWMRRLQPTSARWPASGGI